MKKGAKVYIIINSQQFEGVLLKHSEGCMQRTGEVCWIVEVDLLNGHWFSRKESELTLVGGKHE